MAQVCQRHDVLLIVDDVPMGCGRTGEFFSFEHAGITSDIVALSKSISGYGLPMALTLCKPELDVWDPGEHNGTFRGHNPAFVTATAALQHFWNGPDTEKPGRAEAACAHAFDQGLLLETSGPRDQVMKLLPPLTISTTELTEGLDILTTAVHAAL